MWGSVGTGFVPPSQGGPWNVSKCLNTGGMGDTHIISLPPSALMGSASLSTSVDSIHFFILPSSAWRLSSLFCRVFTKVGGWCCWTSSTPICMYWFTPATGHIFGLLPGTCQGAQCLLALLVFTQQSYCHSTGIRHPSPTRPSSVKSDFSETAAWTQTKFYGKLPIHHISEPVFIFQNF